MNTSVVDYRPGKELQAVLDAIRKSGMSAMILDADMDLAEQAVWETGKAVLDRVGVRMVQYQQYRWFLRSIAASMRAKSGWDLAYDIEGAMRKWIGYQLNQELLEALLCYCCHHVMPSLPEPGPHPKRAARAARPAGEASRV